eukprot:scaffold109183_cov21-Tisochrysis_lutea.AAC.1
MPRVSEFSLSRSIDTAIMCEKSEKHGEAAMPGLWGEVGGAVPPLGRFCGVYLRMECCPQWGLTLPPPHLHGSGGARAQGGDDMNVGGRLQSRTVLAREIGAG